MTRNKKKRTKIVFRRRKEDIWKDNSFLWKISKQWWDKELEVLEKDESSRYVVLENSRVMKLKLIEQVDQLMY